MLHSAEHPSQWFEQWHDSCLNSEPDGTVNKCKQCCQTAQTLSRHPSRSHDFLSASITLLNNAFHINRQTQALILIIRPVYPQAPPPTPHRLTDLSALQKQKSTCVSLSAQHLYIDPRHINMKESPGALQPCQWPPSLMTKAIKASLIYAAQGIGMGMMRWSTSCSLRSVLHAPTFFMHAYILQRCSTASEHGRGKKKKKVLYALLTCSSGQKYTQTRTCYYRHHLCYLLHHYHHQQKQQQQQQW